jgi:hypothetical protein
MRCHWTSVRSEHAYTPVLIADEAEALVVDLAVTAPANQHEIVQIGAPAVGPVDDVVRLEAESPSASVDHAPAVPVLQLSEEPG